MSTFQVRIEDLIGSTGDTTAETDWLTQGSKIVVNALPRDKIELYATEKTDAGSGIDITGGRPLSAHKSGYEANLYPASMKAALSDADSIHYAISTDPAWYLEKTKGYVLPLGGTIRWFGYPTVLYSDSTISNFPAEDVDAVVYYAAIQGQIRIISDLLKTTLGGLSFSIVKTLPTIGSPSVNYTKPTFGGSYTNLETALTAIDLARAQAEAIELNTKMQEYAQDIQNELNEFNKEVEQYKLTLEGDNAELNQYQAEVQKETARIQSLIAVYSSEYQGMFENLKALKEEFQRLMSTL